ncbi:MAG: sodium-dependent transporter [Bacteroidales bacterium]|nr:sodium-dependent transporter [Bacteroidales bacterium]
MAKRENFSSSLGSLLVIAGSAVGLGNIWRFPYMVGTNGGAAFILLYLFFIFIICLPIMVSELTIGRRTQSSSYGAFRILAPDSRLFRHAGIIYTIIPTLILSYYCVIGGITVEFFVRSLGVALPSGAWMSVVWMAVFLSLTGLIVMAGVRKGIERFSKIMMPLLFVIVIFIAVRSMTLPARAGAVSTAADGVSFLFRPDFSKVTVHTCLAALGQAFFSLSLGGGSIMTYGSYINPKDNLTRTAGQIAIVDLLFAIIAGCAVIPAVFALKDDPATVLSNNTDSALVFNILPDVFPQMPFGALIGSFFFFALILAAVTSSISQFEVPVAYLVDEHRMSRKGAGVIVFGFALLLGSLCALRGSVLGFLDGLCANWLMPLGGVVAVIVVGWIMKKSDFLDELSSKGSYSVGERFALVLRFLIRYIAPVGVLAVFVSQLFL